MLRTRELHALLQDVVDAPGECAVDGALLLTEKGSVIATAGFVSVPSKVVSALSANLWSHLDAVASRNGHFGELQTTIVDAAAGVLVLASLFDDGSHFVCLFSADRAAPGFLLARLKALRDSLSEACHLCLAAPSTVPEQS